MKGHGELGRDIYDNDQFGFEERQISVLTWRPISLVLAEKSWSKK
jgi:hypothetical protein